VTPKGRQLCYAIIKPSNKLDCVSPGSPTHWPSDPRKLPDLIDFAVTKNIPRNLISVSSLSDLSSDHSPVLFSINQQPVSNDNPAELTSNSTNWLKFKTYVSSHIELTPQLTGEDDINRTVSMLESVLATPRRQNITLNTKHTNAVIEQLVLAKRRSRREWQLLRSPSAKQQLNEALRQLTKALRQEEDRSQQRYIEQLSPSSSKFPLWKAHSTLSPPTVTVTPIRIPAGSWARSDKDRADTDTN